MEIFYNFFFNNIFLLIFFRITNILSQIKDDYTSGILEEGDYDLLDVTDYHELNIIVSSSKNIYTGIPPTKKSQTNANLINATSLITINENYLLAACLEDSFLGKINLSTGQFTSLLFYSDINISTSLEAPITTCSLSNIENFIFIGYSKIVYSESEEKYYINNIIFKLAINDISSTTDGPAYNDEIEIAYFQYPESIVFTLSQRQISCEPIRIYGTVSEGDNYRLICLYEGICDSGDDIGKNVIYAATIKSSFDDFENGMNELEINKGDNDLGFRIYRYENAVSNGEEKYARCLSTNSSVKIFLNIDAQKVTICKSMEFQFVSEKNLFSFNKGIRFSAEKTNFMRKKDIYCFQVNIDSIENYYKIYNYEDKKILSILVYYKNYQILCIFKAENNIKYFTMKYLSSTQSLDFKNNEYTLKSFEKKEFDMRNIIGSPDINDFGNLTVESIYYQDTEPENFYEYYGIDYFEPLMENNIITPEPSLNELKTYYFSFLDHVENKYTRIFHLSSVNFIISTCQSDCFSCWEAYDSCTDCSSSSYASLNDSSDACYPISFLVDFYLYNETLNKFLSCHDSCLYCSSADFDSSNYYCTTCTYGYLYSYKYPGNCYSYDWLEITEDKEVIITDESAYFASTKCTNYKIAATGECLDDRCPTESPYYKYNIGSSRLEFEKIHIEPPKYSLNKICYEECPGNYKPDENNNCVCKSAFYTKNEEGDIECLSDENCPQEYPYKNFDTNECFENLEKCEHFFRDDCYNNCPDGTVDLSLQNDDIKNYIKNHLTLSENLENKICICDKNNYVWTNINQGKEYYQECLTSCPSGYTPENITNHCISIPTTIITTIPTTIITTIPATITTTIPTTIITTIPTAGETINDVKPPPPPPEPNEEIKCPVKFENICYPECPENTCLTQDDPHLATCVRMKPNTKIINNICFDDFEELTANIKTISESGKVIKKSEIIINAYPTSSQNNDPPKEKEVKYSLVYLGDCENKIKLYYNLSNDTQLYILGIDSPNKDKSSSTNVYNYGVYLEDGTLLDHNLACQDSKISISSHISNPELVKLDDAVYFSDLGYDIFDKNSSFYSDNCAPVSINGNDIIISDRKKDFFPNNISLCNDSCYYSSVDLNSERFTCECNLNNNNTKKNTDFFEEENNIDDIG